ncbi:MAG TPA: acetyl-CoA hydrolase/transferase C-terminal domain-containing protein [Luteibacter sp.]|jgi:acyl-CoA hydrolase|nr:acetyl-CoA hydrolase/transferase C-terminal domain-containing protein [Luteibacter sp.]
MPLLLRLDNYEACLARIFAHTGDDLRVAAPLGLGKPHGLLNALYRRIVAEPRYSLTLFTALSLTRPSPAPGLEARFLKPFLERHFGADFEDLDYTLAQARDALPANVHIHEFYMQSGALLHSAAAQQDYISQNYTHVARDLAGQRINVLVQLVAVKEDARGVRISLSSNPDLTLDLLDRLRAAGEPLPLMVAVAHPHMPYVSGHAEAPEGMFDMLLTPPASPPLFALPRASIELTEYALGLHASALVKDGGTLQIGIGALSDALVQSLLVRHQHNEAWRQGVAALDLAGTTASLRDRCGGDGTFETGLYGSSEMVMDGFMYLQQAGVLKRRSYDDLARERASAAGQSQGDAGGHYLRGAFLLGSRELYRWMDDSEANDPDAIDMCRVSNVNHLYGDHQELAVLQRRGSRFFNTCMMATVLGAAVSDGLEDGSVVSGVGGQYNFVAMAHELPGGRSVLLLRSTRRTHGKLESNIRLNYGHETIPRHLRDVFITEYGIADLRGKSDSECIAAMIGIADARFIDGLVGEAKKARKLPAHFQIPEVWRRNTPERLREALAPLQKQGLLDAFPFGSDFTDVELRLLPALGWLKSRSTTTGGKLALLGALLAPGPAVAGEVEALSRMGFAQASNVGDRVQKRLLSAALRRQKGR